jgi:hypothetical protein
MASVSWISGTPPQVVPAVEGSGTQAYKAGDLVKFSSGTIIVATSGEIDGIARRDATGTTSSVTEVELINLDSVYVCKYKASATAQALVGDILDFTFTAGGHTLDESGATTDVVCVALDPRDAVTTSGGRLYVQFMAASGLKA